MNTSRINENHYWEMYQQAEKNPNEFWAKQAHQYISWISPWKKVLEGDFNSCDIKWFTEGKLNACYNCVDRHLKKRRDQIAIIWEGNSPNQSKTLTYEQLHENICKFANVLKEQGIQKGDRVCIYLPMIPEAIIAMLACARIGAIHSVVFAGFSAEALTTRILDAGCRLVITADKTQRGEKTIDLKNNCDLALKNCPNVEHMIVVNTLNKVNHPTENPREIDYYTAMKHVSAICPIEPMDAADPLFILYTSGSTGKPKGVVHATGGYLVYVAMTYQTIFDYQEGEIYWCTADIGWITGHSYLVYGPLVSGATTLVFEGVPNYPDYSRYWNIIDKYKVNIFYTSPTALRALRQEGDEWVTQTNRSSLKLLGTVGEPINPDVWTWFYEVVGKKSCPIVNTWWQTETGGILLTPIPYATEPKPGSVGWPFFGISYAIVDEKCNIIHDNKPGQLVIKKPWPGLMQTVYGDQKRFIETYFSKMPGHYFTGDGAYQTEDGQVWITGRNDDVIKVSGHRIGTEELESAFVSHPAISEAAVVGVPHAIKGEAIYAFVTPKATFNPTDDLKKELVNHIRNVIGPLAAPETIQWSTALPKTRSGKIMRRILRKIANNEFDELGDVSTLADADVVKKIIKDKK